MRRLCPPITRRDQYATEEERAQAAESLFAALFDAGLGELHAESEKRVDRASGFARMFRFVLPSYRIPGNQKCGAF